MSTATDSIAERLARVEHEAAELRRAVEMIKAMADSILGPAPTDAEGGDR